MNENRTVEEFFGEIKTYFKFASFKLQMKIDLSAAGKILFLVYFKTLGHAYVGTDLLLITIVTPHSLNCTTNGDVYTKQKQKSVKYINIIFFIFPTHCTKGLKVNLSQFLLQNSKPFIFIKFYNHCQYSH